MIMTTDTTEEWIDPKDIRPFYETNRPDMELGSSYTPRREQVIDDSLGLPIVDKPTIFEKYGITIDKSIPFHRSLDTFFNMRGYLTDRQLNAIRKN